jgi:16S rRNA (adenine1518-N6/adenine1519-N6)-dimethyltransferase
MNVKPKKHLGQHFLLDSEVSKRIAAAITTNLTNGNLLEIGPGTGALTSYLIKEDINLIAFEIDQESILFLEQNFPNLNVKCEDILKVNWSKIFNNQPFRVTGNFPYNISSQILFKIYDNRNQVNEMVGMFQKEVAERVCSGPGTKKYGILSVLLQSFYDVDYLFTVDEHVFDPPPKVKSGVMKLKRNSVKDLDCDEKLFFNVVKAIFNQRRKMVRNSIKSLLMGEVIEHPLLVMRPEQLSVADFIIITKLVESIVNQSKST